MKKLHWLIVTVLCIVLSQCSENKKEKTEKELLIECIYELESVVKKTDPEKLEASAAVDVVSEYRKFAEAYPQDSLSPEFLFKSAEVSIGLKKYMDAVNLFDKVYNKYPQYNKRIESLYLKGFVYDNYLNMKEMAKSVYEELIQKHPEHPFVKDAQAAVQALDMTDEQLLDMLKNNSSAQQ
jgi:outer membrane protein assembly factor BamD (BamD/ComL family)